MRTNRKYAAGIFATHGVGDTITTLLNRYYHGPYVESNPFIRELLISHGYVVPAVAMMSIVAAMSLLYAAVHSGNRLDNAFGKGLVLTGILVVAVNVYTLFSL